MSTLPTPHRSGMRVESNHRMVQRHGVNGRAKKVNQEPYYIKQSRKAFISFSKNRPHLLGLSLTGANVQNSSVGYISLYVNGALVKTRRFTSISQRNGYAWSWEKTIKIFKNSYIQVNYDH